MRVKFAGSLHMKVYWAEGKGVVLTSANLSTNALGAGNLKEIGVLFGNSGGGSQAAKTRAKEEYNMSRVSDWLNCRKRDFRGGDWILTFELPESGRTGQLQWMYTDYVVRVARAESPCLRKRLSLRVER